MQHEAIYALLQQCSDSQFTGDGSDAVAMDANGNTVCHGTHQQSP